MIARPFLLLAAPLLLWACSGPGAPQPEFDPALLRLDYLDETGRLPYLRLDGVQLQESSRLGRLSPVVWHFRERPLGEDHFLPLPESYELQDRLHGVLARTLESFGFAVHGWPGSPQVILGVQVRRLRLQSQGVGEGFRACELELEFVLREAPSGLEIRRFTATGESRLEGSWTHLGRHGPRWVPAPGETHPALEAARAATLDFLFRSREFWEQPVNWRPVIEISGTGP